MHELSIIRRSGAPSAPANAAKMSCQIPRSAQRTKRLYRVFLGPYSDGASPQRPPDFNTCTIPLNTRRSSTRFMPRVLVGKNGSMRFHCLSLNQKRSLISQSPRQRLNHTSSLFHTHFIAQLMGLDPSPFCRASRTGRNNPHRRPASGSKRCRLASGYRRHGRKNPRHVSR